MSSEQDLARLYGAAERALRGLLLSIDVTSFNEVKAEEIKKKARRLATKLNLAAAKWSRREVPKAYKSAASRSRTALEILGRKSQRGPARVGSGPKALQDSTLAFLVKANGSISQTVERFLSVALLAGRTYRETSGQVQEFSFEDAAHWLTLFASRAARREESRADLQHKIMNYLRGLISDDGFIDIKGKLWRADKYAKLVARTTLREAQTKATKDLCAQYGNDLVQVSDHETDCEECEEFEGKIYSISGADYNIPGLDVEPLVEAPPYHPNCKHSILPTSVEAVEARAR